MSKPKKTNEKKDLNDYIRKSHIKAVDKFNAELMAFAAESGEDEPRLYEDPFTSFTLSKLRVEHGYLKFRYDGCEDKERIVFLDHSTDKYFETDLDGIMDYVKFWRKCLNRAKRYLCMEPDKLDKIQDGEIEDEEEEED